MIDVERIRAIDWQYLVSRRESLLWRSSLMASYPVSAEVTGIAWRPTADLRPGPDILLTRQDMQDLREKLEQGGVTLLQDFRLRLFEHAHAWDKRAREWERVSFSNQTRQQVADQVEEFFTLSSKAMPFLIPFPIADGVLSQNILRRLPAGSDSQHQEWLKILTYPLKDNEHTKEERAFYELVVRFLAQDPTLDELIRSHVQAFGWIGARGWWWRLAWTEQDVRDRMMEFVEQGKDPVEELRQLEESRAERQRACEALYKAWAIKDGSELDEWIKLAKEYAYLRTWRTDLMYGAGYRVRFLFEEVRKWIGWSLDDVSYVTPAEVRMILETGREPVSREELDRRRVFFGTVLLDDELQVCSGEEGRAFMQSLVVASDKYA